MKTIHSIIGFLDKHIETLVIGLAMVGLCAAGKRACVGTLWLNAYVSKLLS